MTKDKAITLLSEMHSHCILRSATDTYDDALRNQKGEALMMAINALNASDGWTPVAERLPEMGSTVLMQNTGGWMFVATYVVTPTRKYWAVLEHDYALDEAIAWMPLPERFTGR